MSSARVHHWASCKGLLPGLLVSEPLRSQEALQSGEEETQNLGRLGSSRSRLDSLTSADRAPLVVFILQFFLLLLSLFLLLLFSLSCFLFCGRGGGRETSSRRYPKFDFPCLHFLSSVGLQVVTPAIRAIRLVEFQLKTHG